MPVDKILSEFVSTSAHNHNRSTLNYMRGFIVAKRWLGCEGDSNV